MVVNHQIQEAFERAKREFQGRLKNPTLFAEIQKTTCIEEVYDAAEKLQEEQAKRGRLRHLRRIDPYLERLRQYSKVIETFVQPKLAAGRPPLKSQMAIARVTITSIT